MIRIEKARLESAKSDPDSFLDVFISSYMEGYEDVCAEQMASLNWYMNTLLAYVIVRNEVSDGGFLQLMHNGYGGYVFDNPFAKSLKLFGLKDLSKMIYDLRKVYLTHKDDIEADCSDDEFMAKYERYDMLDDYDDEFIEHEEEWTRFLASYVEANIDKFADEITE